MAKKNTICANPEVRTFKLADIHQASYNPRVISDEALEGLAMSIQQFGLVELIIVNIRDDRNIIVGGHQRLKVLKAAGIQESLCIVVDLDGNQEKVLNLSLNNLEIQGQFIDSINEYINDLSEEVDDKLLLDLRIMNLRGQINKTGKIGLADDGDVPEPPKDAITKPGDVWLLGSHRLICGDSTKPKTFQSLMGDQKAKMCFTSPPYNMNADRYEKCRDNLESSKYIGFNITVANIVKRYLLGFLFWNISYNTNTRWEFIEIFYRLIKECGFTFIENIVWDKDWAMPITHKTGLTRQYENILMLGNEDAGILADFCFVGTTQKTWAFYKTKGRGVSNYWRIPSTKVQLGNHKACFPVDLPCKAIDLMSVEGDIILEPFSGSGTTIIAAEKLDRKCFAVEFDPLYCDVAVKRWEAWTGKKANREKA